MQDRRKPQDTFAMLRRRYAPERCGPGELLWTQGDHAGSLVHLESGAVKLIRHSVHGSAVVGLVFAGQTLGLEALSGEPRAYDVVTLGYSRFTRVPSHALLKAAAADPGLVVQLAQQATAHTNALLGGLERWGVGRVSQRLASLVLELGDRVGLPDARGVFVPLGLTRSEMASMAGCRLETAVRCFSSWRRDGWIEFLKEGFLIKDRDALRGSTVMAAAAK